MIRRVELKDTGDITEIYNEYVVNSISEAEMYVRISEISSYYPYFVYEVDGRVVGYCYAHAWKERAAYKYTLETAVYLSPEYSGKGIGKQLMQRLIGECRKEGYHALIACITAGNEISNSLHLQLGFKPVSHFEKVGMNVFDYELLLLS